MQLYFAWLDGASFHAHTRPAYAAALPTAVGWWQLRRWRAAVVARLAAAGFKADDGDSAARVL